MAGPPGGVGAGPRKPVVTNFVGGEGCIEARKRLHAASIPMFDTPDRAMSALGALRQFARFLEEGPELDLRPCNVSESSPARSVLARVRGEGRSVLTEVEAEAVFAAYGLPVVRGRVATDPEEAARLAGEVGYPVVLKVVSPDILHKTEAGGVRVGVPDEAGVRRAFSEILEAARRCRADARIHGVLVQEMAPAGTEVIVGSVSDPQFGPSVMFGLGGIFVEVLKDVTFRVAPVTEVQARSMLREVKGYPLLGGVRGQPPRDEAALARVISRLSQVVCDLGDEVMETDANPVLVYEEGKGVLVLDARIILRP